MPPIATETWTGAANAALLGHVADLGGTWALPVGTDYAKLTGEGHLYATVSSSVYTLGSSLLPSTGAYTFSAVFHVFSTSVATCAVCLLASYSAGYEIFRYSDGKWYFRKLTSADVATAVTGPAWTTGDHTLTWTFDNATSTHTVKIDGTTLWTVSDSSYTPTVIGFFNSFTASTATTGVTLGALSVDPVIPPLAIGPAFAAPFTATSVRVTWPQATGGVGPYTYQPQWSANGTSGWANLGSPIPGTYLLDSGLTGGSTRYYRAVVTDSVPTTVNGAASPAVTVAAPAVAGDVEYPIAGNEASVDAGVATAPTYPRTNVSNGILSDSYVSLASTNAWIGIDLGVGKLGAITRCDYVPRNDAFGTDSATLGATVDGALANTGPWNLQFTLPDGTAASKPFPFSFAWNYQPITPAGGFRFFRVCSPLVTMQMADLRVRGWFVAGVVSRPVKPVINPGAGQFAPGQPVTLTSDTTDAQILYTVDGTTPAGSYSGSVLTPSGTSVVTSNGGPIGTPVIASGATWTVKAVAAHPNCTTQFSDVATAVFNPPEFVPDTGLNTYSSASTNPQDWYDDTGYKLECHNSHIFFDIDTNKYWRTGLFCSVASSSGDCPPRGIWFYTSTDLYNWHREGMLLPPPPNISAWQDSGHYLDSQTRNTILRNPSPIDPNKKYVMYVHLDVQSTGYENGWTGVATAPAMAGPWTWLSKFRCTVAGVTKQSADSYAFIDTDGQAYFTNALRDLTTGSNQQIYLQKLDPSTDWTTPLGDAVVFGGAGREACPCFKFPNTPTGTYYLLSSLGYPYGANTQTGVTIRASTTLAGMSGATDISIWLTPPVSGTVRYYAQPAWVLALPGNRGLILACDWWDAGGSPLNMYNSGHVWYPIPLSALQTRTSIVLSTTGTWDATVFGPSPVLRRQRGRIGVPVSPSFQPPAHPVRHRLGAR